MTLRIMYLSDRILAGRFQSAYTKIGYDLCTRLAEKGYPIAHLPMGRANKMGNLEDRGVVIMESGNDPLSEDVFLKRYCTFKTDILITNKEPWNFREIQNFAINFVPMAIIDHENVHADITTKLHTAFKIIAISRFGQRELRRKNIASTYIPNGSRADIFQPINKKHCKKLWKLDEDDFTVILVGMNRIRKIIPHQLRIYKRFLELNPDVKSHLLLWTCVMPRRPPEEFLGMEDNGVNLIAEIDRLGLGDIIRWPHPEQYWDGLPDWTNENEWNMTTMYNASDANLLCTAGEGAGMTAVEAGLCGISTVCTDYAAAPEYSGPTGIPVKPETLSDGKPAYVIISPPGVRRYLPNIDEAAKALTKLYNTDREKLAKITRQHMLRFDWPNVINQYWIPFLQECENELYPHISKEIKQ